MRKILVSAYACEPDLGSEIGVGWHWVLEMSKYFDLWVLTRESNRHTIESWINEHSEFSHIHFLYFDLPRWARFWKKGLRGVRTYYNIWQFCTNRIVKQTMQKHDIRIFHHLTYGNVLWKVSSYGQKQFFVWGPVGGVETIPAEFSKHYNFKSRLLEGLRRTTVNMLRLNIGFKSRCHNADLILCKTDVTRKRIPQKYADKAILFTDVAADISNPQRLFLKRNSTTQFITVGHLDAWRGFDLIVEAMAEAIKENDRIHLTVVGNGPDKKRLEKLIKKYSLENFVTLTGKVPMANYKKMMDEADAVINAALKEGAVTVSFDCMAMGKPLICFDTTGYTRYFTSEYSIMIPRTGRREVVRNIKDGILRLTDSEEREILGQKAQEASTMFTWENHGKEIRDAILTSISKSYK